MMKLVSMIRPVDQQLSFDSRSSSNRLMFSLRALTSFRNIATSPSNSAGFIRNGGEEQALQPPKESELDLPLSSHA